MTAADSAATIAFVRGLVERAASPYQRVSGFAWRFAKSKMTRDPLFRTLLATGAIPDASCLVDLGCGKGLLAAWIRAANDAWQRCEADLHWPPDWPRPPRIATYLGVDQSKRDIAWAKPAMAPFARVFRGDIRKAGAMTMLDRCDVVMLLDVLHYLDRPSQEALLTTVARSLPPWGVVVMRIGDGTTPASRWASVVDLAVCALRGHPRWRLYKRPLADWMTLLERAGYAVEVLADERADRAGSATRSRFANVLLRASRVPPPSARATEPVR